jgi:hypothetical protein
VVKPHRHLVRLAQYLSYSSPDKLVSQITAETGERKGLIDFILWRWLSWMGSGGFEKVVKKTASEVDDMIAHVDYSTECKDSIYWR